MLHGYKAVQLVAVPVSDINGNLYQFQQSVRRDTSRSSQGCEETVWHLQEKVLELAASVRGIGLLHPITVVQRGDKYVLLSGNHRLECFKHLGRDTIPALIKDEGDELIEQLVECQENLVRADLNAIQTAEHIVKQEELLSALGQRGASRGDNRWKRSGVRTEDLCTKYGCHEEGVSMYVKRVFLTCTLK